MDKIYVIKLYTSTVIRPSVVEVFPNTDSGRKDAEDYAAIMTRNSGYQHITVMPVANLNAPIMIER